MSSTSRKKILLNKWERKPRPKPSVKRLLRPFPIWKISLNLVGMNTPTSTSSSSSSLFCHRQNQIFVCKLNKPDEMEFATSAVVVAAFFSMVFFSCYSFLVLRCMFLLCLSIGLCMRYCISCTIYSNFGWLYFEIWCYKKVAF